MQKCRLADKNTDLLTLRNKEKPTSRVVELGSIADEVQLTLVVDVDVEGDPRRRQHHPTEWLVLSET